MATHDVEVTSSRLLAVTRGLEQLVDWAECDAEHATERGAPGAAKDDRRRVRNLRKALALISECAR